MIKVRLATASGRQQIIVEPEKTPLQILQDNEVTIDGASINLDGIPLTREEFNTPIGQLTSTDSTTLSVVVKTGNAC